MKRLILATTALLGLGSAANATVINLPFNTLGTAYEVVGTLSYDTATKASFTNPQAGGTDYFYESRLEWAPLKGVAESVGGWLILQDRPTFDTLLFSVNYSGSGRELVQLSFQLDSANSIGANLPSVIPATSGTFTRDSHGMNFFYTVAAFTPGVPAVPEPASWALMIGGIGLAGGMVRRQRATRVTYA